MPTYSENEKKSLVGSGLGMVMRNKRYFLWFWLLDLTLAEFGTSAFRQNVHAIMDHSSYANGLVHGFDLSVMIELFARPEFGTMQAMQMPAVYFGLVFFGDGAVPAGRVSGICLHLPPSADGFLSRLRPQLVALHSASARSGNRDGDRHRHSVLDQWSHFEEGGRQHERTVAVYVADDRAEA